MLRFGVALRRYWMARSRDEEALALLMPVLERPEARADPGLFGAALVTAAIAAQRRDLAAARQLGEQAVEFARQLGDDRLLIESPRGALLPSAYFAGEPEQGLPLGQEAVERARQLGDDVLLGRSLMGYLLCSDLIDPARSGQLFAEAIACTERSGDQFMTYILHNNAGVHALRAGDIPAARAHLEAGGTGRAGDRAEQPPRVGQPGLGAAPGERPGRRAVHVRGRPADEPPERGPGQASPTPASAWRAWPRTWATGTGPAELHGVAQAFLDRTGEPWQEPEARYRQDSLDQVRAHLGEEQFDRAYAKGMTLSLDEALDVALGRLRPA